MARLAKIRKALSWLAKKRRQIEAGKATEFVARNADWTERRAPCAKAVARAAARAALNSRANTVADISYAAVRAFCKFVNER